MNRLLAITSLILASSAPAFSQGVELQGYPAGIVGVGSWQFSSSETFEIRLHAGYNITDRKDWGKHDDETGGGPGFGAGATWFLSENRPALWVGARADYWLLSVDWESGGTSGQTDVQVFQPTIRAGYRIVGASRHNLNVDLTLGFGAEVNLITDGEEVGEGAILLAGIRLSR